MEDKNNRNGFNKNNDYKKYSKRNEETVTDKAFRGGTANSTHYLNKSSDDDDEYDNDDDDRRGNKAQKNDKSKYGLLPAEPCVTCSPINNYPEQSTEETESSYLFQAASYDAHSLQEVRIIRVLLCSSFDVCSFLLFCS